MKNLGGGTDSRSGRQGRRFTSFFILTFFVWETAFAGFIYPGTSEEEQKKPEGPTFQEVYEQVSRMPAYWGPELIGADLARKEIADLDVQEVSVIVNDGGVVRGADKVINAGLKPDKKKRRIDWRLLISTGANSMAPGVSRLPMVQKFLARIPTAPVIPAIGISEKAHGTHVAGVIAGGREGYGIASNAKIEDLDVFLGQIEYKKQNVIKAYDFLRMRAEPAAVINMSYEFPIGDKNFISAIKNLAQEKDSLCVYATGNSGRPIWGEATLSAMKECVLVGAFGLTGTKTHFSNYVGVDIVAPGENILSRGFGIPNFDSSGQIDTLQFMSGTSMAAPMVSGVLAMMRGILPAAKAEDLRAILYNTTFDLGEPGADELTGHGLLNAYRAVFVTAQLARTRQTTAAAVHAAVQRPETFRTSQRNMLMSSSSLSLDGSIFQNILLEDRDTIRKRLLLEGTPEALELLGELYRAEGKTNFSYTLQMAGKNRPDKEWKNEAELNALSKRMALELTSRILLETKESKLIASISNPKLLLSIYSKLQPAIGVAIGPLFEMRLTELDESSMSVLVLQYEKFLVELKNGNNVVFAQMPH
ncbi:MAG: S8 family serine peptidase [Deltaproteobacteria bacterium]|nr:S8 family serine peptidase [Deltaproteobacteria bacterium]